VYLSTGGTAGEINGDVCTTAVVVNAYLLVAGILADAAFKTVLGGETAEEVNGASLETTAEVLKCRASEQTRRSARCGRGLYVVANPVQPVVKNIGHRQQVRNRFHPPQKFLSLLERTDMQSAALETGRVAFPIPQSLFERLFPFFPLMRWNADDRMSRTFSTSFSIPWSCHLAGKGRR